MKATAGLMLAAFVMAAAPAGAATGFTSFWALGDSLTDDGNLFAATGGTTPAPPYFDGRFSNGPVWAEHVSTDFEARGLGAENFAFGGATVGPNPAVPNLGGQIQNFALGSQGRLGARPVASLWFGANDVIAGVDAGAARAFGRAAANGVAAGALELAALGVEDVVIFNLPALDRTPFFDLFGTPEAAERARRGTLAFNRTLDVRIHELRGTGLNVIEIDMYGLFNALLDDPTQFGVLDATNPCYVPDAFYCGEPAAQALAFFDPVHPNSVIHSAIADVVRGEVAPVPVPAPVLLLLVGMFALGAVARRRAG